MRTTIILEDTLIKKLRGSVSGRGLSGFVNQCVREHFEKAEKVRRLKELEKSYQRAAKEKRSEEFDASDVEGWPEW